MMRAAGAARALLLLPALASAQAAAAQARYLPQPDTLWYESVNPYRMYVVHGGDTLGTPVRSASVERQVWRDAGERLRVDARVKPLDQPHPRPHEGFEVTPGGRVVVLHEGAGDHRGRWDLVLRLPPDGVLEPGRVWQDTLDDHGVFADGEYAFQARRELRVERIADTLGSRMAVVRGTGTLRYRDFYRADPDPAWWIDVAGPMDETFLFDLRNGRMAAREWWMDLRGIAGAPRPGGVDTVPAGLLSRDTTRLVSAERGRLLARGLPLGDTTNSSGAMSFVHTVRMAGDTVESGFVRPDGLLITARAVYRGGVTERYEMLSTEPMEEPVRRVVSVRDGMIHVAGGRDTVMPVPDGAWSVSDYAMDEHLAQAVVRVARAGREEAEIAVLRPWSLQWDRATVLIRPFGGVIAAIVDYDGVREALLLEKEGTLLYAERLGPGTARRRPPDGSERARRLDALLEGLREATP
jgi:hypothetical protein